MGRLAVDLAGAARGAVAGEAVAVAAEDRLEVLLGALEVRAVQAAQVLPAQEARVRRLAARHQAAVAQGTRRLVGVPPAGRLVQVSDYIQCVSHSMSNKSLTRSSRFIKR